LNFLPIKLFAKHESWYHGISLSIHEKRWLATREAYSPEALFEAGRTASRLEAALGCHEPGRMAI